MRNWPMINVAGGPVEVPSRTLRDLSSPTLYHYDPTFIELYERTLGLLQRVFQTKNDVVIMQGEAILGLEAAAACMINPGDRVLNLVSGVFGKWFEDFITKYGGEVVSLEVPYNDAVEPDDVRKAFREHRGIKFLSVVHSETPSGTVNPVKHICPIAKEYGVVTIVDTVSGLGGEALIPEEWGVDLAVAGPQKCLSGPPGLCLLSVSPDAWKAMENRRPSLRGSYLSILDYKFAWDDRRFPFTPFVNEVYALESALTQVLEEGVGNYAARHATIAKACRAGVKALGLELWAAREQVAGNAVTAVTMPKGLSDKQLRGHMRDRYGVMISGGYGVLAGQLFRLGHMGMAAHPTYLAAQMAILERTLLDLGQRVELGAGVGAAMAALDGWDDSSRRQSGS
ncbi:MAG: pyridoxal-phosphate-dependent aminotransferase family protein [Chloroflexota bacterium]